MAGKYSIRISRRNVDVTASLPSREGVEYTAEGINFSGHESRMRGSGLSQVLFMQGLVPAQRTRNWGSSGLEYGFNDQPYREQAGTSAVAEADVWIGFSSEGRKLGLRLSPEFTDKREEMELFGYAAVILGAVAWFVEDGRNFTSA